ncbi:MAG: efflux RND transporter periplasmic adaptor subunit [Myxococcota bacterium]
MSRWSSSVRSRGPLLLGWLAASAALSLAGPVACSGGARSASEQAAQPVVLSPRDAGHRREGRIASGPRLAGTLEPAERAVMRAEASGSVIEVAVELGEQVEPGQLLGRIEASGTGDQWRSAEAGVRAAEQDLNVAQRDLERTRRLFEAGALSQRDLEVAQSQVSAAEARLSSSHAQRASAGTQLGRTTLKSPIAGVVSERAVNPGDVVSPGSPMFTVIDPSSLRLEGSVPASAVGSLEVGSTVHFEVQGYPGRDFQGTIERIAPAVDAVSRQIPVLVSLPNEQNALVAGLFAEGRVDVHAREGLVAPADAVDVTGPQPVVLVLADGKVERRTVELGLRDEADERVEITSGVQAGDVLVLGAASDLTPGTPAVVQEQQRAAERGDGDGGEG